MLIDTNRRFGEDSAMFETLWRILFHFPDGRVTMPLRMLREFLDALASVHRFRIVNARLWKMVYDRMAASQEITLSKGIHCVYTCPNGIR